MMRWYRALLHLYPSAFRQEYNEALCDAFERQATAITGPFASVRIGAAALSDVIPNAIAEHITTLQHDLRLTRRAFAGARWFHAALVGVLALGIGANAAVFSIFQAVLLRSLPYQDAERLVMVWSSRHIPEDPQLTSDDRFQFTHGVLTPRQVVAVRAESRGILRDVAAVRTWQSSLDAQMDLQVADRTDRLRAAFVTPNFFDILGARAQLGRVFTAADESEVGRVVISDRLWRRAFAADPRVVGRSIDLVAGRSPRSARRFTVVGVLAPNFRFTYPNETEVWALESWFALGQGPQNGLAFYTVARLADGVSLAAAQTRVASIRATFERPNDTEASRTLARVEPVRDWVVGNTRAPLLLLGSVALLLLLITCVTVSSALFVRLAARQREIALRAALGANAARLTRELLTQGFALGVAGTLAGILVAIVIAPALRALIPSSIPRGDEIGVNAGVFAFAAIGVGITTVAATLAPAWRGGRLAVVGALKNLSPAATADRATERWRSGMVGAQSAITTSLLIVATLLMLSFWRLGHVPVGFDGRNVLTVETRLLDQKFRDHQTLAALQERLLGELRTLPEVQEAGLTSAVPFRGVDFMVSIGRVGGTEQVAPNMRIVDSGYFSVMRIPLLRGRFFSSADVLSSQKVAILSDSAARKLFGNANPIGQVIDPDSPKLVIGIVRDVRYAGFDHEPRPALYVARAQAPEPLLCVVVRLAPGARNAETAIRGAFHRVDASVPIVQITTVDQIMSESVAARRFYTVASIAFAALALALTVAGLSITVSRTVIERQRELAIRAALGASSNELVRMSVARGMVAIAAGALIGLVAAILGGAYLETFLFQIPARDPITYGSALMLVICAGGLASTLAAWNVVATAPASLLKSD